MADGSLTHCAGARPAHDGRCPGTADQAVEAVAFSPDGRTIAAAGANGLARLWRMDGWRAAGEFPHEKKVYAVAFSPDGRMLGTARGDSAWVWECATRRRLARITHDNDRDITTVAFRPDGRALATASLDGTARVWSLRAADLVAEACARLPPDLEARVQREYLPGERPGKICPNVP